MTISIDAEKAFKKFSTHLWFKKKKKQNSPDIGHRGNIPQHNKGHVQKVHHKHHCHGEKVKAFPLRSGKRQGGPLSLLFFNIALEILVKAFREEKNKKNPNWKIRSKAATACRWHDSMHRKP